MKLVYVQYSEQTVHCIYFFSFHCMGCTECFIFFGWLSSCYLLLLLLQLLLFSIFSFVTFVPANSIFISVFSLFFSSPFFSLLLIAIYFSNVTVVSSQNHSLFSFRSFLFPSVFLQFSHNTNALIWSLYKDTGMLSIRQTCIQCHMTQTGISVYSPQEKHTHVYTIGRLFLKPLKDTHILRVTGGLIIKGGKNVLSLSYLLGRIRVLPFPSKTVPGNRPPQPVRS